MTTNMNTEEVEQLIAEKEYVVNGLISQLISKQELLKQELKDIDSLGRLLNE